jgi:hypothetical protein
MGAFPIFCELLLNLIGGECWNNGILEGWEIRPFSLSARRGFAICDAISSGFLILLRISNPGEKGKEIGIDDCGFGNAE